MEKALAKAIRSKLFQNRPYVERVKFTRGQIRAFGVHPGTSVASWMFIAYIQDVELKGLSTLD